MLYRNRKYYSSKARKANWYGSNWISKLKRLAIYLRDAFTCQYCGKRLHTCKPRQITLDHVLPLDAYLEAYGTPVGFNEPSNLLTACRSCNSAKAERTIEQYLRYDLAKLLLCYVQLGLEPNYVLARHTLGLDSVTFIPKQKEIKL